MRITNEVFYDRIEVAERAVPGLEIKKTSYDGYSGKVVHEVWIHGMNFGTLLTRRELHLALGILIMAVENRSTD